MSEPQTPLPDTSVSRSQKRKMKTAQKRKKIAIAATSALAVLGLGITGFTTGVFEHNESNPANIFPNSTTEFASVSPLSISATNAPYAQKLISAIKSAPQGEQSNTPLPTAEWKYLNDLFSETNTALETQKKYPEWLGHNYAKAKWDNNTQYGYAYAITNKDKAKTFLNSDDCKTTPLFAPYCGEGKSIFRKGWMILAPENVISSYPDDDAPTLNNNEKFIAETKANTGSNIISAWVPLKTASESLPKEFTEFSSQSGYLSAVVNNATHGLQVKANIFDDDNKYIQASKNSASVDPEILASMPANTVTGFAGSNTAQYASLMREDPTSFLNTHDDWKALSDALAKWGIKTVDDTKSTLGTSTGFSINEGNKGNKVAGTLTVKEANKDKIIQILAEAAKETKSIQTSYKVIDNGNGTITIDSHDPITDGDLKDAVNLQNLLGDTKYSILLAYINMDKNRELLDSSFNVSGDNALGEIGINVKKPEGNKTEVTANWIFPKQ